MRIEDRHLFSPGVSGRVCIAVRERPDPVVFESCERPPEHPIHHVFLDQAEASERAEVQEEELFDFLMDWLRGRRYTMTAVDMASLRRAVTERNRPWLKDSR